MTEKHMNEAGSSCGQPAKEAGGAWQATKSGASKAWEATKEGTAKAWDKTKEVSGNMWEATKEAVGAGDKPEIEEDEEIEIKQTKRRLDESGEGGKHHDHHYF